jgi:hypothetical protein
MADNRHSAKQLTDAIRAAQRDGQTLAHVESKGPSPSYTYEVLRTAYETEFARQQDLLTPMRSILAKIDLDAPLSAEETVQMSEFLVATHRAVALAHAVVREMEYVDARKKAART